MSQSDESPQASELNKLVKESFIALFAAGIGSAITTIMGYLHHASVVRDFKVSFVPWYFGRPIIGMLLGIVGRRVRQRKSFKPFVAAAHARATSTPARAGAKRTLPRDRMRGSQPRLALP